MTLADRDRSWYVTATSLDNRGKLRYTPRIENHYISLENRLPSLRIHLEMVSPRLLTLGSAFTIVAANAVPQLRVPGASAPVSILTADQVSFFKPYTHYAAAAACGAAPTLTWACGRKSQFLGNRILFNIF